MSIYTELKVGDRVVKNPMTMIPNEFSLWGRGEGVGIVVESPFPMEYGSVDVRWPEGRCFESVIGLKKYDGPHNEWTAAHAIYEWNYQRQILTIAKAQGTGAELKNTELFSEEFLLKRPLLEAITQENSPILLIDEIDRADEEFEAYLLELLADYQITIPELGTIRASSKPIAILTSNGTRELSDALRRRCLFHYIDYPDSATELQIIQAQVPECSIKLASDIVSFIKNLRREDLKKTPGVAETLDWTAALIGLGIDDLGGDVDAIHQTLLCVLKTKEDRDAIPRAVFERLASKAA